MIPKVIHYCWFGRGKKPEVFQKCLASWKKYAPDYEIVEWNEDNFDLAAIPFAQEAYDCRKYAFTSDVVRFSVIYEHGGIYLDTDVELLAPLDEFLENDCFAFFQNVLYVATGLGFGAVAKHPVIGEMLEDYKKMHFDINHLSAYACPRLNTAALLRAVPQFQINNATQLINGTCVYSTGVYDAHAVHHDQFSWMSEEHRQAMRFVRKKRPNYRIREALRNPRIFAWFDAHKMKRLKRIYLFTVYDLIEYGVVYWCYRVYQKIRKKFGR